jgi:ABC transport system ATP-binding/permease protein
MNAKREIVLGRGAGCDWMLQGQGVGEKHAVIGFDQGLWIRDLGTGQTMVDGRPLGPNQPFRIQGFHTKIKIGPNDLQLISPIIAKLYTINGLAYSGQGPLIVGSDPRQAHVVVTHPGVSPRHAQIDLQSRTIVDMNTQQGVYDRRGMRLPPGQPQPFDQQGAYFFGPMPVPSALLVQLGTQGAAAMAGRMSVPSSPLVSNEAAAAAAKATSLWNAFEPPPGMAGPAGGPISMPGGAQSRPSTTGKLKKVEVGRADLSEGGKPTADIGRTEECDITLPYPQVSSSHARISRTADGNLLVTDLGSTNGTYVNGARLRPKTPTPVTSGSKIFLGPYPLILDLDKTTLIVSVMEQGPGWGGNLVEIEALDLFLKVPDRDQKGKDRVLLNHVTFKARPGDLIALMGPSGAGKTTLLTVLNGYVRPTSGQVRVNGENLYAIYDALRGSIGYVPQDDIVHPELTVREAIRFSAKLRLPPDYSNAEIERRVDQTLKDLGLEQIQHLEIGKPEKKVLSGGQRKRVNIALELVTDPALMFLDEPTSGLAADDTVALISLLKDLADKSGKTIIVTIHQPAREEYEKFDFAFIMGVGGEPMYYGPTAVDSYAFFGKYVAHKGTVIDNPRDMFDLLRVRQEDLVATGVSPNDARVQAAKAWRADYFDVNKNPVYQKMYTGDREPGKPGDNPRPAPRRVQYIRQFMLLLRRYAIVKRRDKAGTLIMLAQAPIIGFLLAIVFSSPKETPNMWCRSMIEKMELDAKCMFAGSAKRLVEVSDYGAAIFFLVIASIWFGTSNAAREIVSEIAIYRRERMVNLSIFNYLMSKFVLLSFLCIIQCTVLLVMVYFPLGLGNGGVLAFLPMLFTMIVTSTTSIALGLLLSTFVTSSEAAMALTPIALIPQVVLGGRIVPMTMKGWLMVLMWIVPSRWSFQTMIALERWTLQDDWMIKTCAKKADGVSGGKFDCAIQEIANAEIGDGGLGFEYWYLFPIPFIVMWGMTFFFLITVAILLKRRDPV